MKNLKLKIKNSNLYLLLTIFSVTGFMIFKAYATVPQTQTVLKSYFVTGNHPSQANYAEFIDTMFWYVLQTYTNAQQAAVSAAAAQTVWQFVGDETVVSSGSTVTNSLGNLYNISVATVTNLAPGGGTTISAPRADGHTAANYTVYKFNTVYASQLDGVNYHVNFSYPAMGPNLNLLGANSETQPQFWYATNFTRTNFIFYVACYSAGQISGLHLKYTGQ